MELLKRTKDKKDKAQLEQPKNLSFENAYVIDAKIGDQMRAVLGELPIKYSNLIGPIIDALAKSPRANVNLINPTENDEIKK